MSSQLLQFKADPFETLHVLLGWSEDTHVLLYEPLSYINILCHFFRIFNLDLCRVDLCRVLIPQKCIGSTCMHLVLATSPTALG